MNAPSKPLEKFIPNPKLKLREQLGEVMRFKHLSHRTESAYGCWFRGFVLCHWFPAVFAGQRSKAGCAVRPLRGH